MQIRNANPTNSPCVLQQVRVYRGLPDSRRQPKANAANQVQTAAWVRDCPQPNALYVYQRPLKYPPKWPNGDGVPQENGVDVVPTASTARVHLEVASWSRLKRISYSSDPNKPWCHRLGQADFDAVKDTNTYPS